MLETGIPAGELATVNLRRMHDRIRTGVHLIAELEELLRGREPHSAKLAAFDRVVRYLDAVVLPHLRGEVSVLFRGPELASAADPRLIAHLTDNCQRIEAYAERIVRDRDRLRAGAACDNIGCRRHITAMVRLLRRHLDSLESALLPQLAANLSVAQVYALFERIEEVQFDVELELLEVAVEAG